MTMFGPGTYTPDTFLRKLGEQWKFTEEFDLIFMGTCSSGHGHGYFAHTLKEEYGRATINPDFFEHDMTETAPKKVLLLSECCGQFGPKQIEELKRLYPQTEWVTPSLIADYCEQAQTDRVLEDLVLGGIVQRKK